MCRRTEKALADADGIIGSEDGKGLVAPPPPPIGRGYGDTGSPACVGAL